MPLEAIRAAIQPLLDKAGVAAGDFALRGEQLGRVFELLFNGAPEVAARRASKVHAAQRSASGEWVHLLVTLPGPAQASEPLYLDTDKNPRHIFLEKATKKMRDLCKQHAAPAISITSRRSDYVVFGDWVPFARLYATLPREVTVKWNHASIEARRLRDLGLEEKLREALADSVARAQWV